MADRYRSFDELRAVELEGRDWTRSYVHRGSRVLVMAPHGGWIEPYTAELAQSIAGRTFSFYSFQGLKESGNQDLHITSHRFDDPVALEAAAEAHHVVAIHGEKSGTEAFVMVGGSERRLKKALTEMFREAGFRVEPPRPGLGGLNPRNICNRGRAGAGIQLELSEGLRQRLRRDPGLRESFVDCVRSVLMKVEKRGRED